ncbi:MAG: hypothetical protein GF310_10075 [candidate division Zixibacteria bacterium]|nr:hypothetical protein [candidate division Zixibacteria bacterium]
MKPKQAILLLTALLFIVSSAILIAQESKGGKENICEVQVRSTDVKNHYEIEILLTNNKPITAMSFPFLITAGEKMMYYDSISFANSRAEFCAVKIPNPDTANQKINLGLLTSMTPPLKYIDPGEGTIAKLYYTSDKGVMLKDIVVDTTFFPPSNHLMGVLPDAKTNIYPAFKYTVLEEE